MGQNFDLYQLLQLLKVTFYVPAKRELVPLVVTLNDGLLYVC